MMLAAIDVGTNAVRLKIARRTNDGVLRSVLQERDPLRPGHAVFRTGIIGEATVDRLIYTLTEYADLARHHGARLRAVATSALRNASNRAAVLARVKLEASVTLEVISGLEEARLTCGAGYATACWSISPAGTRSRLPRQTISRTTNPCIQA